MRTKREPQGGEPFLWHLAIDTGEAHRLAIVLENFDPGRVACAYRMLFAGEESDGLRLILEYHPSVRQFAVCAGEHELDITRNYVKLSLHGLELSTELLVGVIVNKDLLLMAADIEQCAAIALALRAGMAFPRFEDVRKPPVRG